jgi:hypothetical protein
MAKLWVTHVDEKLAEALRRIVNLEQQVANQALELHKWTSPITLKSQAAQQQATDHLYAPLRSDTKPLLEMAAFVRWVSSLPLPEPTYQLYDVIQRAKEILKRST